MKKAERVRKFEKPLFAAIALIIIAALMMGGTYAWKDFTQAKTNKFRGFADADVTLHDEFDGLNKDVFVENSGSAVIYVRVRLDEYMEIGGQSFVDTAHVKKKDTWTPHTYTTPQPEDCAHGSAHGQFHAYYIWNMSGAQRSYLEGTPGLVYSKLAANDTVDTSPEGGLLTAPAAPPIRLSAYFAQAAMSTGTGCWLLDDSPEGGGWAYWSEPLLPGTATNLLLDSVTRTVKEPTDDWFYGIDVKLQAVTDSDFALWGQNGWTISPQAQQLVQHWITPAATISEAN